MKVFIAGFGTIGKKFLELICIKNQDFQKTYGEEIKVVGVVDSKSYEASKDGVCALTVLGNKTMNGKCGSKARGKMSCVDVMKLVDFDVLVECTPTNIVDGGEGLENILYALRKGKDVITVNKGPLALKFSELKKIADKKGCIFRYEGSVGGGMPLINVCKESLAGQKIKSIHGIFNGTCNYILSKMDEGISFGQALKEAQLMGYAEADPTYDVKGIDCAAKVAILANSIFGKNVTIKDIDVTGIDVITEDAVAMAAKQGMVIRLIGEIKENKLTASPRLIPRGHPLSRSGTDNIAIINTELAGMVTVSGIGAGGAETASAVLSDLNYIYEKRIGKVKN